MNIMDITKELEKLSTSVLELIKREVDDLLECKSYPHSVDAAILSLLDRPERYHVVEAVRHIGKTTGIVNLCRECERRDLLYYVIVPTANMVKYYKSKNLIPPEQIESWSAIKSRDGGLTGVEFDVVVFDEIPLHELVFDDVFYLINRAVREKVIIVYTSPLVHKLQVDLKIMDGVDICNPSNFTIFSSN